MRQTVPSQPGGSHLGPVLLMLLGHSLPNYAVQQRPSTKTTPLSDGNGPVSRNDDVVFPVLEGAGFHSQDCKFVVMPHRPTIGRVPRPRVPGGSERDADHRNSGREHKDQ